MKIRMKKYLALMMAIAIVLPVSNVTVAAAHEHYYLLQGSVTDSYNLYDNAYHIVHYKLYYRCRDCGDTYTEFKSYYANHKFDKGVCVWCGYKE